MSDDFIGPPQSYPEFDAWDEKQHKAAERAIEIMDGIKSYRSAGGLGVGAEYRPAYVQLMRRGGLSADEASQLARYKMWRQGKNTPAARVPEDTPEQVEARRDEFHAADKARRAQMVEESKAHKDDSYTRFYDDLIGDGNEPAKKPQAAMPKKPGGA